MVFFYISGVKFIIVADTRQKKVEELIGKIYELYSDYVLKNPFYSLDMPIRYASRVSCTVSCTINWVSCIINRVSCTINRVSCIINRVSCTINIGYPVPLI